MAFDSFAFLHLPVVFSALLRCSPASCGPKVLESILNNCTATEVFHTSSTTQCLIHLLLKCFSSHCCKSDPFQSFIISRLLPTNSLVVHCSLESAYESQEELTAHPSLASLNRSPQAYGATIFVICIFEGLLHQSPGPVLPSSLMLTHKPAVSLAIPEGVSSYPYTTSVPCSDTERHL